MRLSTCRGSGKASGDSGAENDVSPLRSCRSLPGPFRALEVNVKKERLTRIVLVIVGLINLAILYPLTTDLWHSHWLVSHENEVHPMFLSFFIPVGAALLIASRRPSQHRSMIALAAWWHICHGAVMAIQTVEAWMHGVHRNFADVILFLAIGAVLLALLPATRKVVEPVLV